MEKLAFTTQPNLPCFTKNCDTMLCAICVDEGYLMGKILICIRCGRCGDHCSNLQKGQSHEIGGPDFLAVFAVHCYGSASVFQSSSCYSWMVNDKNKIDVRDLAICFQPRTSVASLQPGLVTHTQPFHMSKFTTWGINQTQKDWRKGRREEREQASLIVEALWFKCVAFLSCSFSEERKNVRALSFCQES